MPERKRVLVVHPPIEVEQDFIDYPHLTPLPAASLCQALKARGHFVHLLDAMSSPGADVFPLRGGRRLFGAPAASLAEAIKGAEFDAAVLHITPWLAAVERWEAVGFLLSVMRKARPEALIVGAELYAGGMHRIPVDEQKLRAAYPELDAVVRLEGEVTVPELIETGQIGQRQIDGASAPAELLDSLAPGLYDFLDLHGYREFLNRLSGEVKFAHYPVDRGVLPVYLSRGCPFSCVFCSNPGVSFRPLSLGKVGEIAEFAAARGYRALLALDDAMNVRKDFAEMLDEIACRGLRLVIPNGLRADFLNEKHIKKLATLTDRLTISAESASPRVQKHVIRKGVTMQHVEQVAAWCRDYGVPLNIHWIVGLPGEKRDDVIRTLTKARALLDEYGGHPLIQYATPITGTRLAEIAVGREGGNSHNLHETSSSSLGWRMQHEPAFLPEGVKRDELVTGVELLRARSAEARTAKVIINLTYRCNNHCLFCAVGNRIKEDLPFDYVKEVLERYITQGVTRLDLDGGEPTLYPDLFKVIDYACQLGYRPIHITTNGRRMSYSKFTRRLLGSGIHSLLVSIHGSSARVHDALTGVKGSFFETLAGIRNAVELKPQDVDFGVNVTLSRDNYKLLGRLVETLYPLGVRKINVQFLTPFGRAAAEVVPDPDLAAQVVREVLEQWAGRIAFQVVNLPYCYLPGLEHLMAQDLGKLSRNMVFVTRDEVNLSRYLAEARKYDERCDGCLYRVACDGRYDFSKVFS